MPKYISHAPKNNKVNFVYLVRLLVYLRGISNIHCTRCKKQRSKLHVSRSFVSIFVIHDEYLLHSLRNNKVNFVYLVRLLVYLQVGAATINCI